MKATFLLITMFALPAWPHAAQDASSHATTPGDAGNVTSHSEGLHGYIGFGHEPLPADGGYSAGMGFYAAVWPMDRDYMPPPSRGKLVHAASSYGLKGGSRVGTLQPRRKKTCLSISRRSFAPPSSLVSPC